MSCCCAAGFTPCSGVSKYVGVNYTSNNWSSLTQEYNGLNKEVVTDKFPNFCHDIKSFPKDGTHDYVAIAGGSYGCRLITISSSKQWKDVGLIKGSSSGSNSNNWKTAQIFGFIDSQFNIGDQYGTRYGWDGFTGVYGIDFFKKLGKTFLLLVCGKNGIDLYNIDDGNYVFTGLRSDSTTSYKKVLYNDGKIFVGTAGYNKENQPSNASFQFPEYGDFMPSTMSNNGVLAYELNLVEDKDTGEINYTFSNLNSSDLSFGEGGVNDIIFNKVDKKIYFSYSHHEDNRETTVDSSRTDRLNDISGYLFGSDSLVKSGGVKRFDPAGRKSSMGAVIGFTLENYHSDPVGQLSQVFDGSVIGARLNIDRVIPHYDKEENQWPVSHLATKYNTNTGIAWFSDFFEHIYTHCRLKNPSTNPPTTDCQHPCELNLGCDDSANPRCDDYTTINYVSMEISCPIQKNSFSSVSSAQIKQLVECFFGGPQIEIDPDGPRVQSLRRDHFGSGITGVSVCSSGEDKDDPDDPRDPSEIILFSFVLSHWQTGFTIIDVYKDWSYDERQQVASMDIQSHNGGTYDLDWESPYRFHHRLHRNFPSTISCGRSTSTRFGPVISITVENIFGDMGPGHYGLHTIPSVSNYCQQLMFNDSRDFNRLRGIII